MRVAFTELRRLVRWVPSLQQPIDELPARAPGFTFAHREPRGTGMAVLTLPSFAAEWPAWTVVQAAVMDLLYARCGFDLRTRGAGRRPAYNLPGQAGTRRLVCGTCCDGGRAELERLGAGGTGGRPLEGAWERPAGPRRSVTRMSAGHRLGGQQDLRETVGRQSSTDVARVEM